MPRLLLPSKAQAQPQSGYAIDWSNPITAGLVAAITPVAGKMRDVLNNVNGVVAGWGSMPMVTCPQGRVATTNSGDKAHLDYVHPIYGTFKSTGYTDFILACPTEIPTWGSIFASHDGANNIGLSIRKNETTNNVDLIQNDGAGGIVGIGSSGSELAQLSDGRLHTFAASALGTSAKLYFDGAVIASGSIAYPATIASPRLVMGLAFNGEEGASGKFALYLRWQRRLADWENRSLKLNPWQVFGPGRRLYFAVESGGVTTTTATAAAGVATVSAVGASTAAAAATAAAGAATVSAVGKSTAVTTATAAAGAATVSAVAAAVTVTTATAADGVATVSGVGASTATASGTAAGAATVSGVGSSTAVTTATAADGVATVSAVGTGIVPTTATAAAGVASVSAVGAAVNITTATAAAGVATVSAAGASTAAASGTAAGTATVSAVGASTAATTATPAAGTATVSGVGSSTAAGQTTAIPADGVATVSAVGSSIAATNAVPAAGTSTVSATTPAGNVSDIEYQAPRRRETRIYAPIKTYLQRVIEARNERRRVKPAKERAAKRAKAIEVEAAQVLLQDLNDSRLQGLIRAWIDQRPVLPAQGDPVEFFLAQVAFRLAQINAMQQARARLVALDDDEEALLALLLA